MASKGVNYTFEKLHYLLHFDPIYGPKAGLIESIIEKFYKVTDAIISPIVNRIVSSDTISSRLTDEQRYFEDESEEYTLKALGTIHDRASTMVSHLSLMLAVCFFLYEGINKEQTPHIFKLVLTIDTLIYILLVLLSIRCLRSIGLDRSHPSKESYFEHVHREIVFKYSIMEIVNTVTIAATVILTGIFLCQTYG